MLKSRLTVQIADDSIEVGNPSREGYVFDLLESGKAVYGDEAFTFTGIIPGDCLH